MGWRMCVSDCPYKGVLPTTKPAKPRVHLAIRGSRSDYRPCARDRRPDCGRIGALRHGPGDQSRLGARRPGTSTSAGKSSCSATPRSGSSPARAPGASPLKWIDAAQRSPAYALIHLSGGAALHPGSAPSRWCGYIPPLSPVVDAVSYPMGTTGKTSTPSSGPSGAPHPDRVPGRVVRQRDHHCRRVLRRRSGTLYATINLSRNSTPFLESVGLTEEQMYSMCQPLALAKYEERYMSFRRPMPMRSRGRWRSRLLAERERELEGGPGMYESGLSGEPARPVPVAVESFTRCGTARPARAWPPTKPDRPGEPAQLGWARGAPAGMFRGQRGAGMKLFSRAQTALNDRVVWQCASLALSYPDRHRSDAAAALPEHVEGAAREHLSTTLSAVQTLDDRAAAQLYVETFDLHRRATLYLTYWTAATPATAVRRCSSYLPRRGRGAAR